MRTIVGLAVLGVAAVAGAYLLPTLAGAGSSGGGEGAKKLDKVADKAATEAATRADKVAGGVADVANAGLDAPWWAYTPPGAAIYWGEQAYEALTSDED